MLPEARVGSWSLQPKSCSELVEVGTGTRGTRIKTQLGDFAPKEALRPVGESGSAWCALVAVVCWDLSPWGGGRAARGRVAGGVPAARCSQP